MVRKQRTRRYLHLDLVAAVLSLGLLWGCGDLNVEHVGTFRLNSSKGSSGENALKIQALAVNPETNRAYVHGILTKHIAVVDTDTNEVVDYLDSGIEGYHLAHMAIKTSEEKLFIADASNNKLIKMDATNGHVADASVALDGEPTGLAVYKGRVLVSIGSEDAVYVYKTSDMSFDCKLDFTGPQQITVHGAKAYVALTRTKTIEEVQAGNTGGGSGVGEIDLADYSTAHFYFGTAGGAKSCDYISQADLYVVCTSSRFWAVDSTGEIHQTWSSNGVEYKQVGRYNGTALLLTRDGGDTEADGPQGTLVQYDTSDWSAKQTWTVGLKAARMVIDEDNATAYVTAMGETNLAKVDLESTVFTATPGIARTTRISGLNIVGARAAVSTDMAAVIGGRDVLHVGSGVKKIDVGESVGDMVVSADGSRLYVADRLGENKVVVYNTSSGSKVDTWSAGNWPTALAYGSSRSELYVVNHFDSTISVLDTSDGDELATIDLGIALGRSDYLPAIALDDSRGCVYTVHPESGMLVKTSTSSRSVQDSVEVADPVASDDEDLHVGRLQVGVDTTSGWVYVLEFTKETKTLMAFNSSLTAKGTIDLTDRDWDDSLQSDILFVDGANDRVFCGRHVIDTGSLSSASYADTLRAGSRVLAIDSGYVVAVGASDGSMLAYALDEGNYKSKAETTLVDYTYPTPKTIADPGSGRLFTGDLPTATVKMFEVSYDN